MCLKMVRSAVPPLLRVETEQKTFPYCRSLWAASVPRSIWVQPFPVLHTVSSLTSRSCLLSLIKTPRSWLPHYIQAFSFFWPLRILFFIISSDIYLKKWFAYILPCFSPQVFCAEGFYRMALQNASVHSAGAFAPVSRHWGCVYPTTVAAAKAESAHSRLMWPATLLIVKLFLIA